DSGNSSPNFFQESGDGRRWFVKEMVDERSRQIPERRWPGLAGLSRSRSGYRREPIDGLHAEKDLGGPVGKGGPYPFRNPLCRLRNLRCDLRWLSLTYHSFTSSAASAEAPRASRV